ncbi:MAG: leucine--tRNA ligase, partial [Bacteroidales bacterium]|nr:leucine--tRNA ligase [Bacteroidales bacterium]
MEYNFQEIEQKWRQYWKENKTYKAENNSEKPKFYILDMFPYPSGAGLHVGHPLGYIASDIYARYKRSLGFNVLHPMGYDAYGLPAEQYAIQTGQHPIITTEENINRYREQLDKIGFSFDWDREVRTCDPAYYKWTQWTFIQLFNHWYDKVSDKAQPISKLIESFETRGNADVKAACSATDVFSAEEWKNMSEKVQQNLLMHYRLAFLSDTMVNWCPQLGTVLANDEVVNGLSVRGGYPVERKLMRQWSLRITAYGQRLLDGLETIDWSDSIKEIQRNWIGRSEGASVHFPMANGEDTIEVFTTRPDTIFGVSFMVLCPEHDLIEKITTKEQKEEVEKYITWAKNRSERERQSEVKNVSGVFTGAYVKHPFTQELIPIWISEYVLAGYGTGAIMAVPAHDSRDFGFARYFKLPITQVISKSDEEIIPTEKWTESYDAKDGICIHSSFINQMSVKEGASEVIRRVEEMGIGKGTINFRLRDAIFSRQRYWGEPFPVYYKNGTPYMLDESQLPLELPEVDSYLPTQAGEPPLANAKNWTTAEGYSLETNTMPGFAGSSGYYLRYMDTQNKKEFFSKEAVNYWQNVDLYVGGAEHATGHLIYARFWNKFLFDIGMCVKDEPFQKLINQGMIQGRSNFVYRINGTNTFVSYSLKDQYEVSPLHVDINIVENDILDIEAFKQWRAEFASAEFVLEDGKYICGWEVEKMSKSMYNVQNPDDLVVKYGADTLRMYEMFLGPIEQSKPWDTQGIEGVFRFIRKFWRLFFNEDQFEISNDEATKEELKILHKTIKKITDANERFSFNTAVSAFMICINELTDLKCNKKSILEPLVVLLSSYAPHVCEELWQYLGHNMSVTLAKFPEYNEANVAESEFNYPVSFNGKMRFMLALPMDMSNPEIQKMVLSAPEAAKWLEGKIPK